VAAFSPATRTVWKALALRAKDDRRRPVRQLRKNAEDCLRQVRRATRAQDKILLLDMAQAWLKLSEQVRQRRGIAQSGYVGPDGRDPRHHLSCVAAELLALNAGQAPVALGRNDLHSPRAALTSTADVQRRSVFVCVGLQAEVAGVAALPKIGHQRHSCASSRAAARSSGTAFCRAVRFMRTSGAATDKAPYSVPSSRSIGTAAPTTCSTYSWRVMA
jgi:hypothetical protein